MIDTEKPTNPFDGSTLPKDRSDYKEYLIEKVGKLQNNVTVGQRVLISAQIPQPITIRNQGTLENLYKINNSDSIFAIINA